MAVVKGLSYPARPDGEPLHVAILAARLLETVRQVLLAEDWDGLRNVHFRVLTCVPPAGATITELAVPLAMTKQAVGQFVGQLQASGHVQVTTDERDRRRRVVLRTAEGDATVRAVDALVAEVEQEWAGVVGRERYAQFRAVLEEIAQLGDAAAAGPDGLTGTPA